MLHSFVQTLGDRRGTIAGAVGRKAGKTESLSVPRRELLRGQIEARMSVRAMALKVGCAPTTLGRFLDGRNKSIASATLESIYAELGIDRAAFLTEEKQAARLLALYADLLAVDIDAAHEIVAYVSVELKKRRMAVPRPLSDPPSSGAPTNERRPR